jgi:hypothetical protein
VPTLLSRVYGIFTMKQLAENKLFLVYYEVIDAEGAGELV